MKLITTGKSKLKMKMFRGGIYKWMGNNFLQIDF